MPAHCHQAFVLPMSGKSWRLITRSTSVSGHRVVVRRVEKRATGESVQVEGPTGIVNRVAGWIFDPVVCQDHDDATEKRKWFKTYDIEERS